MAFILGEDRVFWVEFTGEQFALGLRDATPDEQAEYDRDMAEATYPPGKMAEDERKALADKLFDDVRFKWGGRLLSDWRGFQNKAGEDQPFDAENKTAFLATNAAWKYLIPTVQAYFRPMGRIVSTPSFQ